MRYIALVSILLLPTVAEARPVSYPNGWMVMQNNDFDSNALKLDYSPTAKDSVGYNFEYLRDTNTQLHTASYNRLLKRWNLTDAQGNIFFMSTLGFAENSGEYDPAGSVGFEADYETRRIYIAYENRYLDAGEYDEFSQKFRTGIAPYKGDYDDVNTWLMLEVKHIPEKEDNIVVTPFIRFFYDEYMAEIGVSDNRDIMFNWTAIF